MAPQKYLLINNIFWDSGGDGGGGGGPCSYGGAGGVGGNVSAEFDDAVEYGQQSNAFRT